MLTVFLSIVGVFISFALVVNGFFIKQLVSSLTQVEKGLAVLMEKHNGTSDRMKVNEKNIEKVECELVIMRDRMHKLGNRVHTNHLEVENCKENKGA